MGSRGIRYIKLPVKMSWYNVYHLKEVVFADCYREELIDIGMKGEY